MSKFVDIEKLIEAIEDEGADIPPEWDGGEWGYSLKLLKKIIGGIDDADVRPVVCGEWVEYERAHYFKCGVCKYTVPYRKACLRDGKREYNFCPHCGAKMNLES